MGEYRVRAARTSARQRGDGPPAHLVRVCRGDPRADGSACCFESFHLQDEPRECDRDAGPEEAVNTRRQFERQHAVRSGVMVAGRQ